jgi:hypothetical protein
MTVSSLRPLSGSSWICENSAEYGFELVPCRERLLDRNQSWFCVRSWYNPCLWSDSARLYAVIFMNCDRKAGPALVSFFAIVWFSPCGRSMRFPSFQFLRRKPIVKASHASCEFFRSDDHQIRLFTDTALFLGVSMLLCSTRKSVYDFSHWGLYASTYFQVLQVFASVAASIFSILRGSESSRSLLFFAETTMSVFTSWQQEFGSQLLQESLQASVMCECPFVWCLTFVWCFHWASGW